MLPTNYYKPSEKRDPIIVVGGSGSAPCQLRTGLRTSSGLYYQFIPAAGEGFH